MYLVKIWTLLSTSIYFSHCLLSFDGHFKNADNINVTIATPVRNVTYPQNQTYKVAPHFTARYSAGLGSLTLCVQLQLRHRATSKDTWNFVWIQIRISKPQRRFIGLIWPYISLCKHFHDILILSAFERHSAAETLIKCQLLAVSKVHFKTGPRLGHFQSRSLCFFSWCSQTVRFHFPVLTKLLISTFLRHFPKTFDIWLIR